MERLPHDTPLPEGYQQLQEYWEHWIAQVFHDGAAHLSPHGRRAEFDLAAYTFRLMADFQQTFGLNVHPHEILHMHSIEALVQFTQQELDRLAWQQHIHFTSPIPLYEQYKHLARPQPNFRVPSLTLGQKNKSMVFLHSSPRSGSTLLRVLLAGHPALCAPPELNILYDEGTWGWPENVSDSHLETSVDWPSQGLHDTFKQLLGMDKQATSAFLRELIQARLSLQEIYSRIQAIIHPRLLVDKSPSYSLSLSVLKRAEVLFDKPKIIFLIRHPYAMMESFVRMRLDKHFGPIIFAADDIDPYVVAEEIWIRCNQNIRDYLQQVEPGRRCILRYEDLISDLRQSMETLCDVLDISFDEAVLHPYDGKPQRMITGTGDPNILQHDRIDPTLGERWQHIMLPHQLGSEARRLAAEFGYELA